MIKWVINKWYKHSPMCVCGYRMKSTKDRLEEYSWKCIWKKCGMEAYQTFNGTLHWFKKIDNKVST